MNFFTKQRKFRTEVEEIEYVVDIIMNLPENRQSKNPLHNEQIDRQKDLSCKTPLEVSLYVANNDVLECSVKKGEICYKNHQH